MMITIDKIDFSKLKPYDGKATQCFEHLCYQIAQQEYSHLGDFTPIDGSGGDGGVEFYLKLKNGEKWGWQCKFFGDNGRLNTSSRSGAIEKSLKTACRNHSDLTKWFLCLKTDLTTDSLSSKGKFSKGERSWFENELPKQIPSGRTVVLDHWGESSFITFLKDPINIGIRSFFFGELEFNKDWFKKRFQENFVKVKEKYDPFLHTIDRYTQSRIDCLLLDSNYIKHLEILKKDLFEKVIQLEEELKDFLDERMISHAEQIQRENFALTCSLFKKHIAIVFEKIEFIESCFNEYKEESLNTFKIEELNISFFEYFNKIDYKVFEERSSALRKASSISHLISEFGEIYNRFFRNYFHVQQNELHFLADASKGKTHISCDISYKRIINNNPAIFITGNRFSNETNLSEAILKILDIPKEYNLDTFLQALDLYASILKTKIPIIIDGLNETTINRFFSPIWKNHIENFLENISQFKNLALITTCRNTYFERIWSEAIRYDKKFHNLYGFNDYETTLEAVNKYFQKYKIETDLFFATLEKFSEPIFLKIYCEIKNPNWKNSDAVVKVNIEEETQSDIFNEYLNQVNERVTNQYHFLRKGTRFIQNSLSELSKYLWENKTREIPLDEFYQIIDGNIPYDEDLSKADVLKNENLIIDVDNRNNDEFVIFTYQILSGYLIADYLIKNYKPEYFISDDFEEKIYSKESQHPLYDDILEGLVVILPKIRNVKLHHLITDKESEFAKDIFSLSVTSLFKLPADLIDKNDIRIICDLFNKSNQNKEAFFELSFRTLTDVNHPLNANFFSKLLASINMNQRDITWSEFIRKKFYDLKGLIVEFEEKCKDSETESKIVVQRQYLLSNIIVWFLTSTNRELRDEATRALYYYGRKFPTEFASLTFSSLNFNDPYVWERTLAALYGVSMAEHNSFKSDEFRNKILPEIGKTIYNLIFKENAPHSTTHILARDYARRTIEICLIHHPNIFNAEEIENIRPPYTFGGIRNLGEYDYGEKDYDYSGPIRMDFSNYTIGHIVKDGHSYSNPPEKIKVRKQIYWRIFDLGWNAELFKEAESSLGNDIYYNRGRTERAKTERYGKKYSWIAYFENAGLRTDLDLIDRDWEKFRISSADIDPSFPLKPKNEKFVNHDLLGDRKTQLVDWYHNGGMPYVENYLSIKDLNGNVGEWICLDSFIVQEDIIAERYRFTFIRGLLINEKDYSQAIKFLKKQKLGGRWLPEKHQNHYTFAGELYYCQEATYDNKTILEFETKKKTIKIKKGDAGYYPSFFWDEDFKFKKELPEELEREVSVYKEYETLIPVMEYNWESYHCHLNDAGHTTVVAKEIANFLKLENQPQTFDLFDKDGNIAAKNLQYHDDFNNNHSFVYIRKDLLNKFLTENNLRFVWAIWGEREVRFKSDERGDEFFKSYPFTDYQAFQKIVEYDV